MYQRNNSMNYIPSTSGSEVSSRGYSRDPYQNQGIVSLPPIQNLRSYPSVPQYITRNNDGYVYGSEAEHLLDSYAATNNLNDQLAFFGRKSVVPLEYPNQVQLENRDLNQGLVHQNRLLDDINRKMDTQSLIQKEVDDRMREYKKETKLKMKLMKQNQKIDMLSQGQMLSNSIFASGLGRPPLYMPPHTTNIYDPFGANAMGGPQYYCPKCFKVDGLCRHGIYHPMAISTRDKRSNRDARSHRSRGDGRRSASNARSQRSVYDDDYDEDPTYSQGVPDNYYNYSRAREARNCLKKILWTMVYPVLLENDIVRKILARKNQQLKGLLDTQSEALRGLTGWVFDLCEGSFNNLLRDQSLSYDFVELDPTQETLSVQIKSTRAKLVQHKLTSLFEEMALNMRAQPMSPVDLEYLANISLKEIYAQSNIFSNFEVMRLEFNTYGRITNISKDQSQMIITVNLLIRILVYKLILGVRGWYQENLSDQALLNFKVLGSVLYRLVYSVWDRKVPIVNFQPSRLPLMTTRPLIIDPTITDEELNPDDPEIVIGAFTLQQLSPIFTNNQEWISQITVSIQQWIEEVYRKVANYRRINPQRKI